MHNLVGMYATIHSCTTAPKACILTHSRVWLDISFYCVMLLSQSSTLYFFLLPWWHQHLHPHPLVTINSNSTLVNSLYWRAEQGSLALSTCCARDHSHVFHCTVAKNLTCDIEKTIWRNMGCKKRMCGDVQRLLYCDKETGWPSKRETTTLEYNKSMSSVP